MSQSYPMHPGVALGGVFLSLFGATWLAGASYQYFGASLAALAVIAAGAIGIATWAVATFRACRLTHGGSTDPGAARRLRRSFMLVNAVQWSLIGLTVLVMNVSGHVEWIMPGVIFVVGLHFFPLARMFRYRGYDLTAAALVLVAVLDVLTGAGHIAPSLLATGAILWGSAIALLRSMRPGQANRRMPVRLS